MNQAKGGWTIDRIKQDLMNSGEKKELERKKRLAAEEAKRKKDWRNNLKDFDKTLYVLPAKGTQVYDFTKGLPVNDKIIPKGTAISVKKKVSYNGADFYLSEFAMSRGLPWGIPTKRFGCT